MGNSIGIDASGSLIRVTWICCTREKNSKGCCTAFDANGGQEDDHDDTDGLVSCTPPFFTSERRHQDSPNDDHKTPSNSNSSSSPGSKCPYQKAFHRELCQEEQLIREFISSCPLWSIPKTLCVVIPESFLQKIISCVICWNDIDAALQSAKPFLDRCRHILHLTGSRAAELQQLLLSTMVPETLTIVFHQEIACILKAVDFLVSRVPGSLFRYAKTHKAINSVMPDETHFKAISSRLMCLLDHYVRMTLNIFTSPEESVRVGGSTIGGGTFMGLIRLLCRNVHSPLDAFLLAQSGDNSNIDLLVSDIYGGDYSSIGLKKSTIASTCGKLQNVNGIKRVSAVKNGSLRWTKAPHRQGSLSTSSSNDALDVCCQPHGIERSSNVSYCFDPLCCCCGTRRWSRAETSSRIAAAAAGIISYPVSLEDSSLSILPLKSSDMSPLRKKTGLMFEQKSEELNFPNHSHNYDVAQEVFESDIACSILTMMSYNVAQLAYFNCVIHNCSRILLIGYYLEMPGYLSSIQHCIDFWSGGTCQINFARLAPNLGALGASLQSNTRRSPHPSSTQP